MKTFKCVAWVILFLLGSSNSWGSTQWVKAAFDKDAFTETKEYLLEYVPPAQVLSLARPLADSRLNASNGGRIMGVIRDALNGNGISSAVAEIRRFESDELVDTVVTDYQGRLLSNYLRPGRYQVTVSKESYIGTPQRVVWVERGNDSLSNASLTPPVPAGQVRTTLTWTHETFGAVRDVDSFLLIPGVSGPLGYRDAGSNYHGAMLDHDDTNWVGPETVTILEQRQGTYVYYVNNFSDRSDLQALGRSGINILIIAGSEIIDEISIPQGTGLTYEVYRIIDGEFVITGGYDDTLPTY